MIDLDQIQREATRVVGELRAWAKRDHDGWDVARARSGRRGFAAPWQGERGRAAALRGARRGGVARAIARGES